MKAPRVLVAGSVLAMLLSPAFVRGTPAAADPPVVVAPPGDRLPAFGEYVYVEELPEVLTRVAPIYPDEARQTGVSGTVNVQALVGKDGRVLDIRITKSIPPLDSAAIRCARQWVFKPALSNSQPIAVWVAIPIRFPPDGPSGASPPVSPAPPPAAAAPGLPTPTPTATTSPIRPARILHRVRPLYPPGVPARVRGATVTVVARVGEDGRVLEARVTRSVPELDEAAIAAVRRYLFRPGTIGGKPVATWITVTVPFPK